MLTLKKPIQLKSTLCGIMTSEAFYQRIASNYGLLQAKVSPKELLFLLAGLPDPHESSGGLTSVSVMNDTRIGQNVTIDVINNVVNRILLSGKPGFTYQDNVYISGVLRTLGVPDISFFMEQVRALRNENVSVHRLTELYSENHNHLSGISGERERLRERTIYSGEEKKSSGAETRYYLHESVFQRLDTKEIYRIMSEFQRNSAEPVSRLGRNELAISEFVKTSRLLELAEIKQSLNLSENMALSNRVNMYELGGVTPPPQTEAEVLERAAAAVILNTVDNTLASRIDFALSRSDYWVDIRNSLADSSINTLQRFEYYNTRQDSYSLAAVYSHTQHYDLRGEEINLLNRISSESIVNNESNTFTTYHSNATIVTDGESKHESPGKPPNNTSTYLFEKLKMLTTTENNIESALQRLYERHEDSVILEQADSVYENVREIASEITQSISSYLSSFINTEAYRSLDSNVPIQSSIPPASAEMHFITQATEHVPESGVNEQAITEPGVVQKIIDKLVQTPVVIQTQPPESLPARFIEDKSQITNNTSLVEIIPTEPDALTVMQDGHELARQLDIVNRKNLQTFTEMRAYLENLPVPSPPVPDVKRARKDALRALHKPDEVMEEMLVSRPAVSPAIPELPPVVKAALSVADETTRKIFETLVAYEVDPAGTLGSGLISHMEPAAFNHRISEESSVIDSGTKAGNYPSQEFDFPQQNLPPSDTPVITNIVTNNPDIEWANVLGKPSELTHNVPWISNSYTETENTFRSVEHVDNYFDSTRSVVSENRRDYHTSASIIHRSNGETDGEESKVVPPKQDDTTVSAAHETVTVENIHKVETETITQEIVNKTTEDITDIINRTLARQLGTITERVYGQMERKLQTERARRGRF